MKVTIKKSNRPLKKWMAEFETGRVVHFGATGYQDFTQHRDPERMKRYKTRHGSGRENHGKSGMYTAGFWSMWLLWNKPSLQASARDMERRFGLKISFFKGRGSGIKTQQRTSRKVRSKKMRGILDKVPDPDVVSKIMSYLPQKEVESLAAASSSDLAVADHFAKTLPKNYYKINDFAYYVKRKGGVLDLSSYKDLKHYIELEDVDNTIGVRYMIINKSARLTSKDGKKLIPKGVKTIVFKFSTYINEYKLNKDQPWMDNLFYLKESVIEPVKRGELPEGLEAIENIERNFEEGSIPSSVTEIHYLGNILNRELELFPATVEKISLEIETLEENAAMFENLPQSLVNKLVFIARGGYMNGDDYEEDSIEFNLTEALEALARRDEEREREMEYYARGGGYY